MSRTALIVLLMVVICLELLRRLPESDETPQTQFSDQAKITRDEASPAEGSPLFAPVELLQPAEIIPPQAVPLPDTSTLAATPRFSRLKQRNNNAQRGSRFEKISFEGERLPAGETYWSCAYDIASKLLWEVKLSNAGISDEEHTYSWYQPERQHAGRQDGGTCFGLRCDTAAYIQEMNRLALCGSTTWRLPTLKELDGLIDRNYYDPTINQEFFPNTRGTVYWTDTELDNNPDMVMQIDFFNGMSTAVPKNLSYSLRLVSP